jgi:hypothetical protein
MYYAFRRAFALCINPPKKRVSLLLILEVMSKAKKIKVITPILSDLTPVPTGIHRDVEFMKFVENQATPLEMREFKTQKEFALHFGLSEDTLTDWKKKPEFWQIFRQIVGIKIQEGLPDVLCGLYHRASELAEPPVVAMYLQLAGMEINSKSNKK